MATPAAPFQTVLASSLPVPWQAKPTLEVRQLWAQKLNIPVESVNTKVVFAAPQTAVWTSYVQWQRIQDTESVGVILMHPMAFEDMFGANSIRKTELSLHVLGKPHLLQLATVGYDTRQQQQ